MGAPSLVRHILLVHEDTAANYLDDLKTRLRLCGGLGHSTYNMYSDSAQHCPAFATLLGQLSKPLTAKLRAHELDKPLLLSFTSENE